MARELPFPYTKAERVFKLRYSISIPKVFTYSKEFLDEYTPLQTGDMDIDETLFNMPVNMLVTPAGMAMYLAEGATFKFNNYLDIEYVYEDTNELLRHVVEQINHGFIPRYKPPIKDIIALDTLCQSIYKYYCAILEVKNRTGDDFEDLVGSFSVTMELEKGMKAIRALSLGDHSYVEVDDHKHPPYESAMKLMNNRAWSLYGNSRYNTARYR